MEPARDKLYDRIKERLTQDKVERIHSDRVTHKWPISLIKQDYNRVS